MKILYPPRAAMLHDLEPNPADRRDRQSIKGYKEFAVGHAPSSICSSVSNCHPTNKDACSGCPRQGSPTDATIGINLRAGGCEKHGAEVEEYA